MYTCPTYWNGRFTVICKKNIWISVALTLLLGSACRNAEDQSEQINILPITPEQRELLLAMRDLILPLSRKAKSGIAAKDAPPSDTDDGDFDSLLFAGLLCFSGENDQCDAVKRSQSFEGRMWRSPERAEKRIYVKEEGHTFSRDMGMGVMAYLVKTRDGVLATRWRDYILTNKKRHPLDVTNSGAYFSPYWFCTEYPNIKVLTAEAVDDRCNMTAQFATLFNSVWKFMFGSGDSVLLERTAESPFDYWEMESLSVRTSPVDYNLHLRAVGLMLWKEMDSKNYLDHGKVYKLFAERDPENPFFQYLGGNHFMAANAVLGLVTGAISKGVWPLPDGRLFNHYRYVWTFERHELSRTVATTTFWEYVFLINLLVRDYDRAYLF